MHAPTGYNKMQSIKEMHICHENFIKTIFFSSKDTERNIIAIDISKYRTQMKWSQLSVGFTKAL